MRPLLSLFLALCLVAPARAADGDKKAISRIAFGSCLHQDRAQPIWAPLLAAKPELFLFLGDNIYADTEDMDAMRKMYAQLGEQPGYRKLRKACAVLATWDDHDYGKDDAGAEYPKKKESQQAFLDFFGVPKDSPRRKREGVYHSEVFGPVGKRVQIILLDTRYHRSKLKKDPKLPRNRGQYVANTDEGATILGAEQWKWLAKQLEVPAELRLICSSVQVIAQEHGFEKWMNFPNERRKLFELIRDKKAAGVIFLSGDRHLAELSSMDGGAGYPFYDLTSSGLNVANKRFRAVEPNRHRLAIMDVGNNFGMVRIDWGREDGPLVALEIHDEDGDVTIRHKLPLARLRPGKKSGDGPNLAAQASKQVGKEWTVTLTVQATGINRTKTMAYLNSMKDFRDDRNFTVVLDLKALAGELKAAKITDARKHFAGKKVRVKGTVSEFQGRPQIVVKKLEQVKIAE